MKVQSVTLPMRVLIWTLAVAASVSAASAFAATGPSRGLYIIQAATADAARQRVQLVGAHSERMLDIINAVVAHLSRRQAERLRTYRDVRLYEDRALDASASLLGGLTSTVISATNSVTSAANSSVASSAVGAVATSVAAPLVSTVVTNPLVSAVTSPVVAGVTAVTPVADGSGVATPSLLFYTNYPARVGADVLQRGGLTGQGVTIAVLDSGLWQDVLQMYGKRVLANVNVMNGALVPAQSDQYGHGTHVTSIAAGGAQNIAGQYLSIAPRANIVEVQAFNGRGVGRYVDVIAGLNWIVANRHQYNIRVVNLSFGAPPQSYYWDDPVNQAVMAAWRAGIVVVAAAGNEGPAPMTIDIPGNVPYVITVGALTDNHTPYDLADDRLASFSSTGPTYEGFVKPEIVAPGGHMVASMASGSYLANIDPNSMD